MLLKSSNFVLAWENQLVLILQERHGFSLYLQVQNMIVVFIMLLLHLVHEIIGIVMQLVRFCFVPKG